VDNAAMKALLRMPWKGNIRELDNVIEHAMIVGDGEWIAISDLPSRVSAGADGAAVGDELKSAIQFYERGHISNVLQRSEGDKKRAAEHLGISLSSLYRKIEELGL
jgi:DNA-binding NtrC family response regulator